jgi:hypothetical protein
MKYQNGEIVINKSLKAVDNDELVSLTTIEL